MSDDSKKNAAVSRRDTLKLATAVSALGISLGATLASKDASADGAVGINQFKFDAFKIDDLVLSVHKDPAGQPLHSVRLTPLVTQNLKFVPGTYYLKLTALKSGATVESALDTFSFK